MITDRDNHLWLQTWRDQEIAFHQENVNTLLTRFWPDLNLAKGSRVFVPLCGKSLDMIWLAQQGYQVIGIELSPIAAEAFFRENGMRAHVRQAGKFRLWQHAGLSILVGDYFSLQQSDLGRIDAVYDRAALTALPEDLRAEYIAQLLRIVPDNTDIFLLTTEDADENETMKQALGASQEITTLYTESFVIDLAHVESVFETDPQLPNEKPTRVEYKLYRLLQKQS